MPVCLLPGGWWQKRDLWVDTNFTQHRKDVVPVYSDAKHFRNSFGICLNGLQISEPQHLKVHSCIILRRKRKR